MEDEVVIAPVSEPKTFLTHVVPWGGEQYEDSEGASIPVVIDMLSVILFPFFCERCNHFTGWRHLGLDMDSQERPRPVIVGCCSCGTRAHVSITDMVALSIAGDTFVSDVLKLCIAPEVL